MTTTARQGATIGGERTAHLWPLIRDIAKFIGIAAPFYAPWAFFLVH